jgi:putative aldouronate transport system permease protein
MPTIIIMLILRIGSMMSVGFEKIILLYNPSIYETSDVISSFVYRYGLLEGNYGYSTAVGLFNSVVNFTLLALTNKLSEKLTEVSLW